MIDDNTIILNQTRGFAKMTKIVGVICDSVFLAKQFFAFLVQNIKV
jgi:hypothetical protein